MDSKEVDYCVAQLKDVVKDDDYRRLGKVFKTDSKFYYYDTGTGKVFECPRNVFEVLNVLQRGEGFEGLRERDPEGTCSALKEIISAVENENILKAPLINTFSGEQVNNLEESLKTKLSQVTLEVTDNCNLRCDYCIFQEHNHKFRDFTQGNDMSFNTAKMVLDYARDKMTDEFYVTFYGGEPLLNFPLIKQCIDYIDGFNTDKTVKYSMTTNLTLMTEEKAKYFASIPNFTVVCSIDGNKEIHDEHRKTIDGNGSFDKALNGLMNLWEAYKGKEEYILFNMVLTPPYTMEKFNEIQRFVKTCPYIGERSTIMYSYVENGKGEDPEEITNMSKIEDGATFMKLYNPLMYWTMSNFNKDIRMEETFTWGNTLKGLLKIHRRLLSNTPLTKCSFNGCCIPGGRRLFASTKGKFHVCERIGQAPEIGSIEGGIDLEITKRKYIDEYIEKSISECQRCWAIHLCGMCYASCYNEQGLDIKEKNACCVSERFGVENQLIQYHQMMEKNPEILRPLNQMSLI